METAVRAMEASEAAQVKALGKKAFSPIEGLWIGKPKTALVAVRDDQIVGALLYKFYKCGSKKIGYVDYVFIDPQCHGMGIGNILYQKAFEFMWDQGCDALTALVKDDNVASWSLFLKNKFSRVSFPDLIREFGISGALKQYCSMHFIAVGMDYYLALRDRDCTPSGKNNSAKQILTFLLVNLVLGLILLLRFPNPAALLPAYGCVLCGETVIGFLGTLPTKRRWTFRFINGGAALGLFINLFSVFPLVGRWYPEHYDHTPRLKRAMGINALSCWLFTLALPAIAVLSGAAADSFTGLLGQIGLILSIYCCIPVYPMEAYGGGRVFAWNKIVFTVMTVLTLALLAAVWIL